MELYHKCHAMPCDQINQLKWTQGHDSDLRSGDNKQGLREPDRDQYWRRSTTLPLPLYCPGRTVLIYLQNKKATIGVAQYICKHIIDQIPDLKKNCKGFHFFIIIYRCLTTPLQPRREPLSREMNLSESMIQMSRWYLRFLILIFYLTSLHAG